MPERLPDHPRLHALLGAAVRDLPAALAETLEDALRESAEFVTPCSSRHRLSLHTWQATAGTCALMARPGVKCT